MSGKEIKFGVEGRAAMLKGVDTLADAVQVSSPDQIWISDGTVLQEPSFASHPGGTNQEPPPWSSVSLTLSR
jgi:hypothetical protein